MPANIGTTDRALRLIAGVLLIGLAGAGVIGPWGYIGIVPLATGIFNFCPAYRLFGFSTCPARSVRPDSAR
ncbi:MAG: DUF2892 domain-containing protein [Rhizobacter sp.]